MPRLLGVFCLFWAMFFSATDAAFAEACTFGQAGYDSIGELRLTLSAEEGGSIYVRTIKTPQEVYRFEVVEQRGVKYLYRTDKGVNDTATHFAFFDENLVATSLNSASPAPAYIFITAYPAFGETMFQLKRCKLKGSTVSVSIPEQPAISVSACPFLRAVYSNLGDGSLTIRSEKDEEFFADMKVIIKGDRNPERPYTFGFTNGIGTTYLQSMDDNGKDSSQYMFMDESFLLTGISSKNDPAPAYFFLTSMPHVPASMFRLTECRADTPKSAQ
jgi:hypothetical protein